MISPPGIWFAGRLTPRYHYNTEIVIADGIEAYVVCDGASYSAMSGTHTLGSIFNPKKEKRLIGGSKEVDCVMYALDKASSFNALWGIGISHYKDKGTGVILRLQANGSYRFEIRSIENFVKLTRGTSKGALSDQIVKELVEDKVHEIIKSKLESELSKSSILEIQGRFTEISADTMKILNEFMRPYGIKVLELIIGMIRIHPDDIGVIDAIQSQQTKTAIAKIGNEVKRDQLQMQAEYEVATGTKESGEKKVIVCAKCLAENDGRASFCSNCGEKLIK